MTLIPVPPTPLPSGTLTFLFTDIEGSTRLWELHPDEMLVAVARHDALLRLAVAENEGFLFKTTGDGIAAAFQHAANGLSAALAAQQALTAEPWPDVVVIRSRMGLHTGTADWREGDYYGAAVNRAARITAAGRGGQILLSDVTCQLTRESPPADTALQPLGEFRLKGLTRPETLYQVKHPDLLVEFPPPRTFDVSPNNLPQQVTSFVGREKPLADVAALLEKTHLLTLTGSGGSGKTRLALQTTADTLDRYPDGAWLAELAALADPSRVPQTVATALGVREQPGQPLTRTLTDYLTTRRILLVLDNCEHVLSACAALVAALIRACPTVRVIATSREPLGIAGETTYRVPGLTLPSASEAKAATPTTLGPFEAVRLFVERARAVKTDFGVTDANAPSLAQLCYRLDGIPLAIELAAARVRALAVEQIHDKLDSRFRLLTGGDRGALPRLQTLRAAIDWSYDLLTEKEKTLLARLAVFAGGWTLEAAETVCGAAPIEDFEMLDLLTSLSDKSLIQTDEQEGASRYRMLESVRDYAVEKLLLSGAFDVVQARHGTFFLALTEEAWSRLDGPEQGAWLNRLETEHDNLRAALLSYAAGPDDGDDAALAALRLSGALWRFWWVRGYLSEGREQLARALARRPKWSDASDDNRHARNATAAALRAAGALAYGQGDFAAARPLLEEGLTLFRECGDLRGVALTLGNLGSIAADPADTQALYQESLSLFRQIGDKRGIALVLVNLGSLAFSQGDLTAARSLCEEGLCLYREIGDRSGIALTLGNLGVIVNGEGDYTAAQSLHEESLSLRRDLGDKIGIANTLINLGLIASTRGDCAIARSRYQDALGLHREVGDRGGIAYGLEGIASVYAREGDARRAVLFWAAAGALRASIGAHLPPSKQADNDAEIEMVRATMTANQFAAVWEEGQAMTWEQAVKRALE